MDPVTSTPAESTFSPARSGLLIGLIALLALVGGYMVADQGFLDSLNAGTIRSVHGASVLEPPRPIPAFTLTDSRGEAYTQTSLRDRWTFVFFGYTYCPDVCPMALTRFNEVHELLSAQQALDDVHFMFVSVDPPRDSLERLGNYVTFFNRDFLAATGDPDQIETFARASGAVYVRVPGRDESNYLIDHSAAAFLYDPDGRLHAVFNAPHDPFQITRALAAIRSQQL